MGTISNGFSIAAVVLFIGILKNPLESRLYT